MSEYGKDGYFGLAPSREEKRAAKKRSGLSAHDRAELDKFELYLKTLGKWDDDNVPPLTPNPANALAAYNKKRLEAQFAIYRQIYGELA